MIHFETPQGFFLLASIPIFYILRRLGIFSRIQFPLTISDWGGKTFTYRDSFSRIASFTAHLLAVAGFCALVTALANPVIRHQEKIFTSRGTDILFVLDTSPSMAARDILLTGGQTRRLDAAKIGIKTLVSSENGASWGLVAMASEAACIVPPTDDTELFLKRLDDLDIGEFGEGSAIGIGLATAIYHLSTSAAPKKCIVLITDGENNAGQLHPETAAKLASENKITIYTFGIGTKGTVPIEYTDKKTGKTHSGFYESEFNTSSLEEIAELAGGSYFGIESTAALSDSLSQIAQKEDSMQTFHYRTSDKACYANFLLLSLIFFFAAWLIKRLLLSEIL
ncbi:MAG: VWA domain-containing protein [Treponema sp.]|nr:VWA domain-containing protein [Treponema sp.]